MSLVTTKDKQKADNLKYEREVYCTGYKNIAGVDEAGRGPLAGPVVAAAVILPENITGLEKINDSKKLSAKMRQECFMLIHEKAKAVGVGVVDAQTIDQINILQATFLAMQKAVNALSEVPDYLFIDGNRRPDWLKNGKTIIDGDSLCLSVSAASIIAKVIRDKIMDDYDCHYPKWGFGKHKGYGTVAHMCAIRENGICDLHRKTFSPISKMIDINEFL